MMRTGVNVWPQARSSTLWEAAAE